MRRGLDIEKIEAALTRAAYKAVYGTREERSGRFLVDDKLAHARKEIQSSSAADTVTPKDDSSAT